MIENEHVHVGEEIEIGEEKYRVIGIHREEDGYTLTLQKGSNLFIANQSPTGNIAEIDKR